MFREITHYYLIKLHKELEGKCVGDEVEILLKAEDAFGKKADELILLTILIIYQWSIDT